MVAFDMLQVAKELEAAFTPVQAEALVKVFARALTEDLATKRDLAELETRLRAEIKELETSLRTEIAGVETGLRNEIKDLKVDIVKWIVGALLVNFFGVAALVITLIKTIAH